MTLQQSDSIGAGAPADQANLQTALWVEIVRAGEANNAERFATKGNVFSELAGIRTSIEMLDAKLEKMDTRLDAKIDKTVAGSIRSV